MKLIKPVKEFKRQISAYRREFLESGESMDGTSRLRRYDDPSDWIEYVNSLDGLQYIFVREEDGKIVGMINIRNLTNGYLEKYGGHIGFSVAPSERRKGYAAKMLKTALPICKEFGIDNVLITCLKGNEGSRKTILSNGGIYESTVYDPETEHAYVERYRITLAD